MYGMVNEGVHTFIVENHGAEAWQKICDLAGVETRQFERMSSYSDDITYRLVGAVSEYVGLSTEKVLEVFGAYWIDFAGSSTYGNLLRLAGDSFIEKVQGLDEMHERILLAMPHLQPPSFEIEETGSGIYLLHYYSEREGLAPMVHGLLHGLAALTGESITVRQIKSKPADGDHDVFEIVTVS